jgi:hypothetical protein
MELEDHNCWTIAEAAGHRGPHRLQHLLSRAVWDERQALDAASAWAVSHLDDGNAVLIVDETANEKSSADAAGAARQYSGTLGGIALCQVAVTLTYATGRGHTLIDRALYLPGGAPPAGNTASWPASPAKCCSPASRSWLVSCWNARTRPGSAPPSGRRRSVWRPRTAPPHPPARHGLCAGGPRQPSSRHQPRPYRDRRRGRPADPRPRLAADAHRAWHQGRPPLRLGDAGGDQRRHPRRAPGRAQRAADPAAPLHRHAVVLPVLDPPAPPRCPS